ncbi:MAG: S4 domain-containing protein [Trueperaceae bacterium]|nr:S4 domain-containing protein [Truepera sp.]HRQ09533.1 S4 domain-containing protein [Trueperaceae bacterium]
MNEREARALAADLSSRAQGGRVAFSEFLEPDEADALMAELRAQGVRASAWGGYPGARRRVVCALPDAVPEATPQLTALYVAGDVDPDSLRAAAQATVGQGRLGDAARHQDGASLIVLAPMPQELASLRRVAGAPVEPEEVRPELAFGGNVKSLSTVVPSLRVDVLGARAFGVSRSYFSKGVAAGRVTVNGKVAGKATSAEQGDEVYAAGLGRFKIDRVEGETRRGNLKVTLAVERG